MEGNVAPLATLVRGTPEQVYGQALSNALSFYQTERDGPDYIPNALS